MPQTPNDPFSPETPNVLSFESGRMRQSLPALASRCMAFSALPRFDDALVAAVRDFYGLDMDVVTAEAEILEDEDERIRFFPWFLWDWRPTRRAATVGERFRAEEAKSAHEERLVAALCQSSVGFYEALEDASKSGVRVRDLFTDETLNLTDPGLTGDLFSQQILQARLVRVGFGAAERTLVDAVYAVLPASTRATIVDELTALGGGRTRAHAAQMMKAHTAEMLELADRLMEGAMRPVTPLDADGERLVLSRSVLSGAAGSRVSALLDAGQPDLMPVADGDGDGRLWAWLVDGRAAAFVRREAEDRVWLLSSTRSRHAALETRICGEVGTPVPVLSSLEDLSHIARRWVAGGTMESWLSHDRWVQKGLAKWFANWALTWLDLPLVDLGGRTPREAARIKGHRAQVVQMVDRFEGLSLPQRHGHLMEEVQRIRSELALLG